MKENAITIDGGLVVKIKHADRRLVYLCAMVLLVVATTPLSALAQGSIFGTVQNSDLSTPANGDMSFFGVLDDTDEEIRIEISTGAGYDGGFWFDDFQNYLTEAPGNPYDYYFYNVVTGEGYQLFGPIPNNSFQQENILLASVTWPSQPTGVMATAVFTNSVVVAWNGVVGLTYHVYRRPATSGGSFFRLDDVTGSPANPGVVDSFFVDTGVDGVSSYDYLIIAEDAAGNYSEHSAVATVNSAIPSAPLVNSIDPASGFSLGGTFINIYGSGFDMAGVGVVVGSASLTGITVVSPFHVTGTTQAGAVGPADVTVTNTLSALAGMLPGGYTYTDNAYPVLATIGAQSVAEGNPLSFVATATDADGGNPIMTSSALPTGATYVDNGDGTGSFDWTPDFTQAGTHNITFYATDAVVPTATDSEVVAITVANVNREPVLTPIGDQAVAEDANVNLLLSAPDPDGDFAVFTSSVLPGTATLTDNLDGTAIFDWTPSFTDSGSYVVTFYAADGAFPTAIDSETVTITVSNTNRLPVLAAIGPQSGTEEAPLSFGVSATDDDGDTPSLSTSVLPAGAGFVDNGDGSGSFDWTPSLDQQGTHLVTFYVTDGVYLSDSDSEVVLITIANVNQPPILASIGAQGGMEGELLSFALTSSDPDGTYPVLTSSALPTGAVLTDNGDGTGSFDWTPDFTQGSAAYDVTFYASDGEYIDSELVTISIVEVGNQAPSIAAIGPQSGTEGISLDFTISASDPDGSTPILSTGLLPIGASFADNLDGTGGFSWIPGYTQDGVHVVTFYATDGVETDSEVVAITIADAGNQSPSLVAIGSQATTENVFLGVAVTATDPDSTTPVLSTSALPTGAVFVDNTDGTGTFDWTPDFTQAGSYDVTFYADDGEFTDSEIVNIVVADNLPPDLAPIGAQVVAEDAPLVIAVTASDPNGTFPALTTSMLPTGATFTDNGDGSGTFDWTPDFTQGGNHDVSFYASDGEFIDSEQVVITVTESGDSPPVIVQIPDTAVSEGEVLVISVSASDPEGGPIALTIITTELTHYTFADNGDGSAVLTYGPDFYDAGEDTVVFFASEIGGTGLASSETVVITTVDVNQPPILEPLGPFAVVIFDTLEFTVTAHDSTDPILDNAIFLLAGDLPENASFVRNGDNTGTFTFMPVWGQDSTYNVTFWAVDQGTPPLSASQLVTITVQTDNLPPEIDTIGPQIVLEGEVLVVTPVATDADGAVSPEMLVDTLHENASFVDNANGTGTYTFSPNFVQSGLYNVTFGATDGIDTVWTEPVLIQVTEAGNQVPIFDPFPFDSVTEGETLEDFVSGSDPDSDPVEFSVVETSQPENFTLVDSGNGVAGFFFSPSYTQAGTYDVLLVISDTELADTLALTIEVIEAGNQPPVLDTIVDYVVNEDELLQFTVTASDVDGPPPDLSTSVLPGTAAFDGPTGLFEWTPSYDDSAAYTITFYAADADDPTVIDSQDVQITVVDVNRTPWYLIPPIYQDTVAEGDSLEFTITAWDDDGSYPNIEAFLDATDSLATNMAFSQGPVGTEQVGTLSFKPDYHQGDDGPSFYYVRFRIVDEFDPTIFRESGTVTFRVYDVNQPPYLEFTSGPGPFVIGEGENISFNVFGHDDDDDAVTVWAEDLPDSNVLTSQPDPSVMIFSFSPDYIQSGVYNISFIAEDEHGAADTQIVEITVIDGGNGFPVIEPDLPDTVDVYTTIAYGVTITATDPEGQPVLLSAINVPANASWDTTGGVGLFQFVSQGDQIGQVYAVDFVAEDAEAAVVTMTVNFHVNNFLRGDTDGNDMYTVNDVIFLAGYMFRSGNQPAPVQSGDVDNSGQVDVADLAYLVNYMYNAGPRPPQ